MELSEEAGQHGGGIHVTLGSVFCLRHRLEKRLCEVLLPPYFRVLPVTLGLLGTEWVLSSHGGLGVARRPQPPS